MVLSVNINHVLSKNSMCDHTGKILIMFPPSSVTLLVSYFHTPTQDFPPTSTISHEIAGNNLTQMTGNLLLCSRYLGSYILQMLE